MSNAKTIFTQHYMCRKGSNNPMQGKKGAISNSDQQRPVLAALSEAPKGGATHVGTAL